MKYLKQIIIGVMVFLFYYFFSDITFFLFDLFKFDYMNASRLVKIILIYSLELIPLITLVLIYKDDLKNDLKNYKENFIDNLDKYVKLYMLALILMTLTDTIITAITGKELSNNEQAVRSIADTLPIYSALSVCICAPIVEELIYRKTIKNIFINNTLAIIASGLIFGLAHVIGTYQSLQDLLYIIPYGAFGAVFMYIFIDSKNIWSTITIHFMHNTILLLLYFVR